MNTRRSWELFVFILAIIIQVRRHILYPPPPPPPTHTHPHTPTHTHPTWKVRGHPTLNFHYIKLALNGHHCTCDISNCILLDNIFAFWFKLHCIWPKGSYRQIVSTELRNEVVSTQLGPYSLSGKTSNCKISCSLEATIFGFRFVQLLINLTGTSTGMLSRCLPNFLTVRLLDHEIVW